MRYGDSNDCGTSNCNSKQDVLAIGGKADMAPSLPRVEGDDTTGLN